MCVCWSLELRIDTYVNGVTLHLITYLPNCDPTLSLCFPPSISFALGMYSVVYSKSSIWWKVDSTIQRYVRWRSEVTSK
jgi:hypothetical protein